MMPAPLTLTLTEAEIITLREARDHHPRPYVRERAAGLLKVAAGGSARHVALHGLLRPRHARTVSRWIQRFREDGYCGLLVAEGRGRKPAFSPTARAASRRPRATARPHPRRAGSTRADRHALATEHPARGL